ncbi:hypothetical protein STENM327S_00469 [Streptomyces tendae]
MSTAPTAPTVAELEEQERRLVFRRFTNTTRGRWAPCSSSWPGRREAPVAIDIHRAGQQLFHAALPGSTADNDAWIARKRRLVGRYGSASYLVGSRFRAKGTTFEESSRLDPGTYARTRLLPPHGRRCRRRRRGERLPAPQVEDRPAGRRGAGARPWASDPRGPWRAVGESPVGTRGWSGRPAG